MKKQMSYANERSTPYVAMVGENELASGTIALKDMATGEQLTLTVDEVIARLK
jgi:histidyl-tRNA synthetase